MINQIEATHILLGIPQRQSSGHVPTYLVPVVEVLGLRSKSFSVSAPSCVRAVEAVLVSIVVSVEATWYPVSAKSSS